MTLHQLRIFAAVAKHLNVTRASEELYITQPSVSYQLKLLETECRAKLYNKLSRGIELTERGQLFLRDVEPILLRVERVKEQFRRDVVDGKARSLTIGGSHGPSASFLPMVSALFNETHPQVQLTLRTDSSRAIEQLVLSSEVDIALVVNPSHSAQHGVERCRQEELVVFASIKHPLAKRRELTLAELAQAPLIIMRGKAAEEKAGEILRQLERQGFKPNIAMQCESPEALKATVKTGMGLGILYRDIVEPYVKTGELKIIKVPELKMKVDTFIIYRKEDSLSPDTQDFLTLLRGWPKKLKPGRVDVSLRAQ